MNTAQTVLTQGAQTQQIHTVSKTALWIAVIAGAVLLTWFILKR